MKTTATNKISVKEIKNLDTTKIKSFQLLDGSVIIINNSKSSQDEQNLSNQPRPLFTRLDGVESSQQQLQYSTSHKIQVFKNVLVAILLNNQQHHPKIKMPN